MQERPKYKRTLFDKHGPEAENIIRAFALGGMVFCITLGLLLLARGLSFFVFVVSAGAALASLGLMLGMSGGAGGVWNWLMASGASTPAVEQFSYQDALVMQGRVADALASYEAVIAEDPAQVTARMRAAELYLREPRNVERAVALLKEAQHVPDISAGEDVYLSNRIADLLAGPLNKPGAALVELRRLIERYPTLPAAAHARDAIARIKSELMPAGSEGQST